MKTKIIGLLTMFVLVMIAFVFVRDRAWSTGEMDATAQSNFVRDQGILYIRSEYFQAKGLSVLERGEFRPVVTIYEWWLDASNPWRFRRVTSEQLDAEPQIVEADGSDGLTGWWNLNREQGMTEPQYHDGQYPMLEPGQTEFTFADWIHIFSGEGQYWISAYRDGKAQEINQRVLSPWGKLIELRQVSSEQGHTTTITVMVEAPNIWMEKDIVDATGNTLETVHLTNWDWLETGQLPANFWMTSPQ